MNDDDVFLTLKYRHTGQIPDCEETGTYWVNDQGQLHQLDGPAVIYDEDGAQEWYRNGQLHRLDGPAAIHSTGTKVWYQNGLLHRLDGPAVIYADGSQEWWVDGNRVKSFDVSNDYNE